MAQRPVRAPLPPETRSQGLGGAQTSPKSKLLACVDRLESRRPLPRPYRPQPPQSGLDCVDRRAGRLAPFPRPRTACTFSHRLPSRSVRPLLPSPPSHRSLPRSWTVSLKLTTSEASGTSRRSASSSSVSLLACVERLGGAETVVGDSAPRPWRWSVSVTRRNRGLGSSRPEQHGLQGLGGAEAGRRHDSKALAVLRRLSAKCTSPRPWWC